MVTLVGLMETPPATVKVPLRAPVVNRIFPVRYDHAAGYAKIVTIMEILTHRALSRLSHGVKTVHVERFHQGVVRAAVKLGVLTPWLVTFQGAPRTLLPPFPPARREDERCASSILISSDCIPIQFA
jgi:hypothetical protein